MKTTHILTAALLPCLLLTTPAFAQDNMAQDAIEETVKDEAKTRAKDQTKDMRILSGDVNTAEDGTVTATGDPLIIETPSGVITAEKGKMIMTEEETAIFSKDITSQPKMIQSPAIKGGADMQHKGMPSDMTPAPEVIKIACPAGTTAQSDGTCMITGDYAE